MLVVCVGWRLKGWRKIILFKKSHCIKIFYIHTHVPFLSRYFFPTSIAFVALVAYIIVHVPSMVLKTHTLTLATSAHLQTQFDETSTFLTTLFINFVIKIGPTCNSHVGVGTIVCCFSKRGVSCCDTGM